VQCRLPSKSLATATHQSIDTEPRYDEERSAGKPGRHSNVRRELVVPYLWLLSAFRPDRRG
jgi:hypothetical protein